MNSQVNQLARMAMPSRPMVTMWRLCREWAWLSLAVAGLLTLVAMEARADDLRELYLGARAQAMGGAFTGLADDEEAIFYNAAGLAGIKKFTVTYASVDAEISSNFVTQASTMANAFQNFTPSSLDSLMGQDFYANAQFAPTIVVPNFGIALLSDAQASLTTRNAALPQMEVGYQVTNGIQAAYGTSVLRNSSKSQDDLRIGGAVKLMWRRGGYETLDTEQLFSVSQSTLTSLEGTFQEGIGADLGMQYIHRMSSKLTASWGLAWTDLGNTSFGTSDPQLNNLSTGIALSYKLPQGKVNFTYDFRHLAQDAEFQKKNHMGLEYAVGPLSLMAGLNETMYLTYGASVDFWLLRLTLASYAEEMATDVGQDPERRYLAQLEFRFGM